MAPGRIGVVDNPWSHLRAFTDARIGLGRVGISLPTHELLAFQYAHARARDAVHLPLDLEALDQDLAAQALPWSGAIRLHSQAVGRTEYLQRPDLGRRLDSTSRATLQRIGGHAAPVYDLALVVVDGLSSRAIQDNAVPFLKALDDTLNADSADVWRLAPLTVVNQGRVAVGDEVGELLNANTVVVLVGERPGLSSPDSLGLYLTWGPKTGRADSERNCISNVRPAGLAPEEAARRLMYLLRESRQLGLSGVGLKDRTTDDVIEHHQESKVFLLS
ncbi:ethanolamine ammonia-lyase subunit EutC [Alcanivoracaceae bacterium MT1]